MIPRIIHQTWKDADSLPVSPDLPQSWRRLNPGWEYKFWTDALLDDFVAQHYPDFVRLYQSYPNPVQRADLARYLLLEHFGGVYADLDTRAVTPLSALEHEDRLVLCCEPQNHHSVGRFYGFEHVLFNGVMASPKSHPFWAHMRQVLWRCRSATDYVLESTGPFVLSGAAKTYAKPDELAISSCHLFTPCDKFGTPSPEPKFGPYGNQTMCDHTWNGTWWNSKAPTSRPFSERLRSQLRRYKYRLTRGAYLDRDAVSKTVKQDVLQSPLPSGDAQFPKVAVFIPVRDASPFLERCFQLLNELDYPKEQLRLVFCEGDSDDDTVELLRGLAETHRNAFADIKLIHHTTGNTIPRKRRWLPKYQKARRAALAAVRNRLIVDGLQHDDDWVLWLDVDVCDYDRGILKRLLDERAKVVAPACGTEWGGPCFDLNTFLGLPHDEQHPKYYKYVRSGLYMPPADLGDRRHLHHARFLDRVSLSGVGGTMLLVQADIHRAGLTFPEVPYRDLLETEGFAAMCLDFGVTPIGLPNEEVLHVKS